jgi:hypothetical protein
LSSDNPSEPGDYSLLFSRVEPYEGISLATGGLIWRLADSELSGAGY